MIIWPFKCRMVFFMSAHRIIYMYEEAVWVEPAGAEPQEKRHITSMVTCSRPRERVVYTGLYCEAICESTAILWTGKRSCNHHCKSRIKSTDDQRRILIAKRPRERKRKNQDEVWFFFANAHQKRSPYEDTRRLPQTPEATAHLHCPPR